MPAFPNQYIQASDIISLALEHKGNVYLVGRLLEGGMSVERSKPPESEMHTSQEGKASITLLPFPIKIAFQSL